MSVALFIVALLLLVSVHEFGHFIVAKKLGIRVDEFAFGFPPRLWSITKGETTYAINALPLGGYVKIYGEDPNEVDEENRKRSFVGQRRALQGLVIVAGVFFNLLFAWVLFASAFMIGVPVPEGGGEGYPVRNLELMVTEVAPNSPASEAGLASGDVLRKFSDGLESVNVTNADQVVAFVGPRGGHTIALVYKRHGYEQEVRMIPKSGIVPNTAAVGIYMDTVGTLELPPHIAFWVGLKKTYQFTLATAVGLVQFLVNALMGHSDFSQITGPVGMVRAVSDAAGVGFSNVILFVALISINLALINLLPFPALDGGRLLFIVIEGIIRRPIRPNIANAFNMTGFALLMLLMIAVTYHDVVRLVH